jgi:hypothetical protein
LDRYTTPTSQSSAAGLAGQDTASSIMCRGTRGRRVESMIIGKVNLTRYVCWICVLTPTRTDKKLKKREEAASRKLIAETTKQCPGCKRSIEKSFGCDHMSCKIPNLSHCDALHIHTPTPSFLRFTIRSLMLMCAQARNVGKSSAGSVSPPMRE